jgi:hypothetical protein
VHTIGWLITDDCNRSDGVGSRFFTVQNSGISAAMAAPTTAPAAVARVDRGDSVVLARGFGELGEAVYPDAAGVRAVSVRQTERIELRLPNGYDEAWQVVAGERRALPIGANWDPATHTFAWQPAPGFFGKYEIVFVRGGATVRVLISVL